MEDNGRNVEDNSNVAAPSVVEENNNPAKEGKTLENGDQKIRRVEHLLKVELFRANKESKNNCLRNWCIGFACVLGLLFFVTVIVCLAKTTVHFYKDSTEVFHEVSLTAWKMYTSWGHLVLLAIVGGLFGYTLYLIKRVYDSEAYERKKDLELNRKLHQEKVAHEMSEPYRLYQQKKDVADKMFALEKTCLEAKINKEEFDKELKNFMNEMKHSQEKCEDIRKKYDKVINNARWEH